MIDWNRTRRRWLLIAVALAAATVLLRGQLSTMLVERGDVLAYAGDVKASSMYERALLFDPADSVAADRLAFRAILSHDPARIRRAIGFANRELAIRPADATIEMDRALCFQVLGEFERALTDFSDVGMRLHDPRALLFAADDAVKSGNVGTARVLLRRALQDDPKFRPAALALGRIGAAP